MNKQKVIKIGDESISFEGGFELGSDHQQDCCENHYLSFSDLSMVDFEGLEFDLSGDTFFKKIEDYGIELVPIHGHSVEVPGYGSNNGYYSSELTLVLTGDGIRKDFDISEGQVISG